MIVRRRARAGTLAGADAYIAAPHHNESAIGTEFVADLQLTSESEETPSSVGFRLNHVPDGGHVRVEQRGKTEQFRFLLQGQYR